MKPRKFRPKARDAGTLVGTQVLYIPAKPPLESAAEDQRSHDRYAPDAPFSGSMREFYLQSKAKHEALHNCVNQYGTIRGYMGQSGSWPPLFEVEFEGGLTARLGVNDLALPPS